LSNYRYTGECTQEDVLQKALESGPQSMDYTSLVAWLSDQLKDFCSLQESVNPITGIPNSVLPRLRFCDILAKKFQMSHTKSSSCAIGRGCAKSNNHFYLFL